MCRFARTVAALTAVGMVSWGLPVAADSGAAPPTAGNGTEIVAVPEQLDDFAFPGRDYEPGMWPANPAQEGDGTDALVGEYDDFAFPGRDYVPLLWPPTPVTEDSAFPGEETGTPR